MRFYFVRIPAYIRVAAFDQVRTKRSLCKKSMLKINSQLFGGFRGYFDEHRADDPPLFFRIAGHGKRADNFAGSVVHRAVEKFVFGIDAFHMYQAELFQILTYAIAFVFAHHTVVDMDGVNVLRRQRA